MKVQFENSIRRLSFSCHLTDIKIARINSWFDIIILSMSTKLETIGFLEVWNYFLLTSALPNFNVFLLIFILYKKLIYVFAAWYYLSKLFLPIKFTSNLSIPFLFNHLNLLYWRYWLISQPCLLAHFYTTQTN